MRISAIVVLLLLGGCAHSLPPSIGGATFCQIAKPITWSSKDSRKTKEAVDTHNRVWVELCKGK